MYSQQWKQKIRNLLFIDIETVCAAPSYEQLPERMKALWDRKAGTRAVRGESDAEKTSAELFYEKGAFFAEFGKAVCIAFGGFYFNEKEELSLRVRSLHGTDEAALLLGFRELTGRYEPGQLILCAHNGKEFDFPFLCRRMLINSIEPPDALRIQGKKPWEIQHLDTMDLWKFGDYKSFTSLDLLAAVFDIPGSKSELTGDQVTRVYYEAHDFEKICRYCREDVVVLAQIYLKLHTLPLVKAENITRVE